MMKMMIMIFVVSEYHLHHHNNMMQGHVCVVGDRTSLNNPMPAQGYDSRSIFIHDSILAKNCDPLIFLCII